MEQTQKVFWVRICKETRQATKLIGSWLCSRLLEIRKSSTRFEKVHRSMYKLLQRGTTLKQNIPWRFLFLLVYILFFDPIINIKIGIVISKAWLIAYTNSVFCMICADVTQFHYQLICALNFTRSLGSSWCTYSSVSTGNESRFISN